MNNLLGVIVDAGHGGEDPGAISGSLKEKDFTLKAAKYMTERLRQLGIDARMTREEDTSLPKSERIKKVKELFNNQPNVILISNHINAGRGEGAEIVYALKNNPTLATLALENIKDAGQISRGVYQRVLPENPSKDYYYIIRESGNVEPLLVEYGFIDNSRDQQKLQNDLLDYVEGVVKAIADYTNTPYSPPGVITEDNQNTYVVKKGDTLYSIANQFQTSVQELISLNNLKNNTLYIGQTILVSDNTPQDVYVVKRGDTLYSIANQLKTKVDILKDINNLTSDNLYIGQELKVPSTEEIEEEEEEIIDSPEEDIYIVKKGDSLWSISKKYNISVEDLINLNNLENINLKVGDQLYVPRQEENIYVVKKGDTLWSISKELQIPVNQIKEMNNLTSNLLSIGQNLIIP